MPPPAVSAAARGVRTRWSPGRALAFYLLLLAGPTLVLLLLGLRAVQQQRAAIEGLAATNRRLTEQRVVDLVERRVTVLAGACLQDPELLEIVSRVDWSSPASIHAARVGLRRVQARHALAGEFFALTGEVVHLPRSSPFLPTIEFAAAEGEASPPRPGFGQLLAESAALERAGRWNLALRTLRQARPLADTVERRALIQSRLARVHEHLGDLDAARQAHLALAAGAPDAFDAAGRPYALVAGVELLRLDAPGHPRLAGTRPGAARDVVAALRRAMDEGVWDLTEDEWAYFDARVPRMSAAGGDTRPQPAIVARRAALAHTLRTSFRHHGPLAAGQVYGASVDGHQVFYTRVDGLPAREAEPLLVGLDANLDLVRHIVFPAVVESVPGAPLMTLVSADEGGTSFRSVLPFWGVTTLEGPAAGPRHEALIFGATVAAVLGLLVLGVVFLLRDVTRERATAQLRTDLVGGVSHELKTPLSVIRLYAEMLAGDPDAPREERRSFYEVISAESLRLSHLIERVLDFSRVSRGRQEYVRRPARVGPIVTQVAEGYRPYLEQQGFTLVVDVRDRGREVLADEDAVSRALICLIENAVKYSGDERHVAVRALASEETSLIEVEDRGLGIAPEDRARLFERFYRGARTGGRGGYGLGLYLVGHVMDAHGGRIEVDSDVGRGSTFRLVFPSVTDKGASSGAMEESDATGARDRRR